MSDKNANCYACSGPVGENGLSTAGDLEDEVAARTAGWETCRGERDELLAQIDGLRAQLKSEVNRMETYAREDAADGSDQALTESRRWFRVGRAEAFYAAAGRLRKAIEADR